MRGKAFSALAAHTHNLHSLQDEPPFFPLRARNADRMATPAHLWTRDLGFWPNWDVFGRTVELGGQDTHTLCWFSSSVKSDTLKCKFYGERQTHTWSNRYNWPVCSKKAEIFRNWCDMSRENR